MLGLLFVAILTSFPLSVAVSANAQQTDRDRDGLTGKVNTVVEESGWQEGNSSAFIMRTAYDLNGNIAEVESYTRKADGSHYPEKITTVYERDAEGRVTYKKSQDEKGALRSGVIYTYDDHANLTEEQHVDKDGRVLGKIEHRRSSDGKDMETKTFLSDGKLKSESREIYDRTGRLIEFIEFAGCDKIQNCSERKSRTVNIYDSQGHMTESQIFTADGKLDEKRTYKYDPKSDRIVELHTLAADKSVKRKEEYKYKVDSMGNWVEKLTRESRANSRVREISIIRRTITYHSSS